MIEMPELVKNICRIFYYKVITTYLWDIRNYCRMR
jgi:hypothetical protein